MTKYWKTLVGAAVLVGGASSIAVADGYEAVGKGFVAPRCSAANWNGFYGGINGGYVDHRASLTDLDAWAYGSSLDSQEEGGSIGGTIGYNVQNCMSVVGIESDIAWTNVDKSFGYDRDFTPPPNFNVRIKHGMEWFGTIRGRAGIAVHNMLLFATAGLAYANVQHSWTPLYAFVDPAGENFSDSDTKWGWVFGGGGEWAFSSNMSFKTDVLYAKFGDGSHTLSNTCFGCGPGGSDLTRRRRFESDDEVFTTRVGLNFFFGP